MRCLVTLSTKKMTIGAAPLRLRVRLSAGEHARFVGSRTAVLRLDGLVCPADYQALSAFIGLEPVPAGTSNFDARWVGDFSLRGGAQRARRSMTLEIPPSKRVLDELPESRPIVRPGALAPSPRRLRLRAGWRARRHAMATLRIGGVPREVRLRRGPRHAAARSTSRPAVAHFGRVHRRARG